MRVNVYAEELTHRVELVKKGEFTGVRIYLELPCTIPVQLNGEKVDYNVRGPFMHRPDDDDSSAITIWGKQDLAIILRKALDLVEGHLGRRVVI